jgi:sodium transport system permease protein
MRLDAIKVRTIYAKELRETLRDRRTIFAALVFPMLLYPLLMLGMAQATALLTRDIKQRTLRVGLANEAAAPELAGRVREVANIEVISLASDPAEAIEGKRVDAVIAFTPGSSPDAPAGVETVFNGADELSREARDRIADLLSAYRDDLIEAHLRARAVDPSILEPFETTLTDRASAAERGGFLLGRLAALMLIFMSLLGAFYPALDLAAGEKERGTIETLLVSPASRAEIVAGKYLAILTISIVTALVNLGSMALTFSRLALVINTGRGGIDFSFAITATQAAIIFIALLPFAALTSALAFAISTLARSFKEGQNYLTPLVVLVLLPANLAILPGLRLTIGTAFVPVLNATLLVREALLGPVDPLLIVITTVVTALLAAAALVWARSLFESEQVLLRDSGDLDWKFWQRAPGVPPALTPWHGLLTFAVVLVLLYYVGSAAQEWDLRAGLVITEILVVLAPAIAAVRLAGVGMTRGLGLRAPSPLALAGAAAAGLGSALVGIPATGWLNTIIPPPPEFMDTFRKLGEQLTPTSPADYVFVLVIIAVLPAVCEEALHRGVLMRGLLTRFGPVTAIVTSGLLFGVFHLSPYRFVWTATLGVLLGWIAYRSGSLISSIVAHGMTNGSLVLLPALPAVRAAIGLSATGETGDVVAWVGPLGLALVVAGLLAIRAARPEKFTGHTGAS